ncbi:MAG TPA: hypothetical protein VGQ39_04495 [Pyrinomonadaceae bacterium]|jgi:hypothetical protein|nr:hypothetical protein [Pyrinomonadaceae bacterium]
MRRLGLAGYPFIALGITFVAIGFAGQRTFVAIGVVFLVLGILALSRK